MIHDRYHHNNRHSLAGMTKFCVAAGLLAAATAVNAGELGRLFFTPEQRMQLEASQPRGGDSSDNSHSLTVNGIVQKQGGQRTVWINGVPQPAGKSDENSPESLPVAVPGQSQPVKVKVGQRILLGPTIGPNTTMPNSSKPDAAKPNAPEDD